MGHDTGRDGGRKLDIVSTNGRVEPSRLPVVRISNFPRLPYYDNRLPAQSRPFNAPSALLGITSWRGQFMSFKPDQRGGQACAAVVFLIGRARWW